MEGMNRLPIQRVELKTARPDLQAADIIIATIRQHGGDPRKMYEVPLLRGSAQAWTRGEMSDDEFIGLIRNLVRLFPNLRAQA